MATESTEADFTCPFCGRNFDGQDVLADHFQEKHDFDGLSWRGGPSRAPGRAPTGSVSGTERGSTGIRYRDGLVGP